MEVVESLTGKVVALDTAPLIYFIEEKSGANYLLTNDRAMQKG